MLLDVCAPFISLIILSVWEQLQKSDLPPAAEDEVKWEAEFNQMMNDQRGMDFDYDTMGPSQWESPSPPFQSLAFDSDGIPLLGDYEFGLPFSLIYKFMGTEMQEQRETINSWPNHRERHS